MACTKTFLVVPLLALAVLCFVLPSLSGVFVHGQANYGRFVGKHVLLNTARVDGQTIAQATVNNWCNHFRTLRGTKRWYNINSFIVVPRGRAAADDFPNPAGQRQRVVRNEPVWLSDNRHTIYTVEIEPTGQVTQYCRSVQVCTNARYWAGLEHQRGHPNNPLPRKPNHFGGVQQPATCQTTRVNNAIPLVP